MHVVDTLKIAQTASKIITPSLRADESRRRKVESREENDPLGPLERLPPFPGTQLWFSFAVFINTGICIYGGWFTVQSITS